MTAWPALAMSPAAQAWLAETTTARVLHVFDRTCNLVNSSGRVLAVVTSERGLTPFALVVASGSPAPFRAVNELSEVWVQSQTLRIGPVDIDGSAARSWNPVPDWPALRRLSARGPLLGELADGAIGRGPAGSLLELFAPHSGAASALPAVVRHRAREGALRLVAGLRAGSADEAASGAQRLAGLGGGLTPAGDDFVLGVLLAAWAGSYGAGAEQWAATIAEAAAPLTTTLSAAYMLAAARGECSAYWHALFEARLCEDAAAQQEALGALLAVGHTSGADALAGFLAHRWSDPLLALIPQHISQGG